MPHIQKPVVIVVLTENLADGYDARKTYGNKKVKQIELIFKLDQKQNRFGS